MNMAGSNQYSSEQWVSSKLQCGLGNRLFQLAAAHKMADTWFIPLIFAMPYCSPSEHGDFNTIFKLFPDIPKVWNAAPEVSIEQRAVFQYEPLPALPPANKIILKGFWQAGEYVLDSLKPSWEAVPDKDALLKRWNLETKLQKAKTAFLHVRLGDYKLLPHHQVNLLSYFDTCIKRFPEDTRFLVFTDSPEEIKALPVFNDRCVFVQEQDEYKAMYLMSRCWAGAICANSTFSWWGAFFARQLAAEETLEFRAYMPSKWMAVSSEPTEAIYPPWATVISVQATEDLGPK
jgi:hypothetical protein